MNHLIKSAGAKLEQTWQDVAAEFLQEAAASILPPGMKEEGREVGGQSSSLHADLADAEWTLLKLVPVDAPVHMNTLAEASGLPVQELAGVLLSLEMRKLVRQLPGKCFIRKL